METGCGLQHSSHPPPSMLAREGRHADSSDCQSVRRPASTSQVSRHRVFPVLPRHLGTRRTAWRSSVFLRIFTNAWRPLHVLSLTSDEFSLIRGTWLLGSLPTAGAPLPSLDLTLMPSSFSSDSEMSLLSPCRKRVVRQRKRFVCSSEKTIEDKAHDAQREFPLHND